MTERSIEAATKSLIDDLVALFSFPEWEKLTESAREEMRACIRRARAAYEAEKFSTAARDVLSERQRQIDVEGWTPEHDDTHDEGEMALAAACYAVAAAPRHMTDHHRHITFARYWPWAASWWKPKAPRENLVRAGALILAEIERLDRTADKAPDGESDGAGVTCPICTRPILPTDLCATDINLGVCHAGCLLRFSPVDPQTGEPVDGPMDTYRYGELEGGSLS